MVPFSLFFVKFIISLSGLLTPIVLSIPFDNFDSSKIMEQKIKACPKNDIIINLSAS
jgi:hypothetical protein